LIEHFQQLLDRLQTYSPWEVVIELAIIWVVLYLIFRFLRGTRGAGIIKGLALLLIVATLAVQILGGENHQSFQRLTFLYNRSLAFLAIAFLVIFQPELRRALIKLGETPFLHRRQQDVAPVIDAIVEAAGFLARNRIGAIIAIERQVGLGATVEGGTLLNAECSAPLLQTIFWPNSALHDLGVVIRGSRVLAAGVQFPMADTGTLSKAFGSRHRAAVGVTLESDCLAIVVSEERGEIRLAAEGKLSPAVAPDDLSAILFEELMNPIVAGKLRSSEATSALHGDEPENAFDDHADNDLETQLQSTVKLSDQPAAQSETDEEMNHPHTKPTNTQHTRI